MKLVYRKISNKHPCSNKCPSPYLDLFLKTFTKLPASNKRPLEINEGKPFLPTAVCFRIHCSISKKNKLLFSYAFISQIHMSRVMRKPTFCICENKDADQLRGNREADQRLCFRYIDSTIPLLSNSKISSL